MTDQELLDFFAKVQVGDLVESNYHPYVSIQGVRSANDFREAIVVAKHQISPEIVIFHDDWLKDYKGHSGRQSGYYNSVHLKGNWIISYPAMSTYGGIIRFCKHTNLIETNKDYADLFE